MLDIPATRIQEKRYFLIRGLACDNITQEKYDAEMPPLDQALKERMAVVMEENLAILEAETKEFKATISTDGNFKRAVAGMLIELLHKLSYSDNEIKGIMRQGYKRMRGT